MKEGSIHIINGNIITPQGILRKGQLLLSGGKIIAVYDRPQEIKADITIDAKGRYVSPGFIDIHVHGGGGYDFMDGTTEAFLEIAALHARYGTTAMMPTTLSGSREELDRTLQAYVHAGESNDRGAQFLGMHLEGPYFAMEQRGAQDPQYIRHPDPDEYREIIQRAPFIKRWSAAPELPGALEFGRFMKDRGVLVAFAHTNSLASEIETAMEYGYNLATHLYSGMLGVTRKNAFRYAGAVEAALLHDAIDVEIIADGAHLPAALLKLVYKIKGADRIALVTDAMRAAGMPEGDSILGSLQSGQQVIVEDGVAKLPDRSAFAGSVATADRLVRTMVQLAGISLSDAVKMISSTPARILGLQQQKGSVAAGLDADIVLFDDDIRVSTTIIRGKLVYESGGV